MKVTVMRFNHGAKEVQVAAGSSVGDAISASGFQASGHTVTLNGESTQLGASLSDGAVITLVPKVEGGAEQVKVNQMNRGTRFEALRYGDTIASVLARLGIDPSGNTIHLNPNTASLSDRPQNGDCITLTPKVQGGLVQ